MGKIRLTTLVLSFCLLTACAPSPQAIQTAIAETQADGLTTPSVLFPQATFTLLLTETPKISSPTPVPSSLILVDFPLSMGATWQYSAEISYEDPNDYTRVDKWSGSITDQVVAKNTASDGRIIFTLHENMDPAPPKDVWRQSADYSYTISGNGIFKGNIKIYQWPLSNNLSWDAFGDYGYFMDASYVGNVDTPYRKLEGCYVFVLATLPDTSNDTFCPGIGFVEHSYTHNGTRQEEHFTLISYEPGQ
jgi:hypothetical protein